MTDTAPTAPEGDQPVEIPAEGESPWYFYVCAHQSANTPCAYCHPPTAEPVPDNWMQGYVAPGEPGATDATPLEQPPPEGWAGAGG